jgi:hypothetical protein
VRRPRHLTSRPVAAVEIVRSPKVEGRPGDWGNRMIYLLPL